MPRLMTVATLVAVACLSTTGAYAKNLCTGTGTRQTEAAIKASYKSKGYKIKHISAVSGCYEIKGTDHAGKKVNLYVSPWTGETVKSKT